MLTNEQIFASQVGEQLGAQNAPLALYAFPLDEMGRPFLIGGSYDESGLIHPNKLGNDVFLIMQNNSTGKEFRLSFAALKKALDKYELEFYYAMELEQIVVESIGQKPSVIVNLF